MTVNINDSGTVRAVDSIHTTRDISETLPSSALGSGFDPLTSVRLLASDIAVLDLILDASRFSGSLTLTINGVEYTAPNGSLLISSAGPTSEFLICRDLSPSLPTAVAVGTSVLVEGTDNLVVARAFINDSGTVREIFDYGITPEQTIGFSGTRSNVVIPATGSTERYSIDFPSTFNSGPVASNASLTLTGGGAGAATTGITSFRVPNTFPLTSTITATIPAANRILPNVGESAFDYLGRVFNSIIGIELVDTSSGFLPSTMVTAWDATTNTVTFNRQMNFDGDTQILIFSSGSISFSSSQPTFTNVINMVAMNGELGPASYSLDLENIELERFDLFGDPNLPLVTYSTATGRVATDTWSVRTSADLDNAPVATGITTLLDIGDRAGSHYLHIGRAPGTFDTAWAGRNTTGFSGTFPTDDVSFVTAANQLISFLHVTASGAIQSGDLRTYGQIVAISDDGSTLVYRTGRTNTDGADGGFTLDGASGIEFIVFASLQFEIPPETFTMPVTGTFAPNITAQAAANALGAAVEAAYSATSQSTSVLTAEPMSSSAFVMTQRDTSGVISNSRWDYRDSADRSSTSLNPTAWTDLVNNFFAFDPGTIAEDAEISVFSEGLGGVTITGFTLTDVANPANTATFATPAIVSISGDWYIPAMSLTSSSGTPPLSIAADMSITLLGAVNAVRLVIDTNVERNINGMLTITANSGTDTSVVFNGEFSNGELPGPPSGMSSTYLIEDYAGTEFTTITGSVLEPTATDIATINNLIRTAINDNTETPTDFMASVGTDSIALTSSEKERVANPWTITVTHPAQADAGDIMYGQAGTGQATIVREGRAYVTN